LAKIRGVYKGRINGSKEVLENSSPNQRLKKRLNILKRVTKLLKSQRL
jgi:hypothetical protein